MNPEAVIQTLESIGAAYALIGGHAVALRGFPRLTADYDFLTTDRRVFEGAVWSLVEEDGATVEIRKGDPDDPLAGVVHLLFEDGGEADIVVGKWKWQERVIERAERLTLRGIAVPVPRTSDLILLKLTAGGYLDLQDVYGLLHAGNREQIMGEVEQNIGELDHDAREAWQCILTSR